MDAARARFEAALARCEDDHYARSGLAYVLLRAGDATGAASLWRTVVAARPQDIDALTGLGLVAWREGDVDAVRAAFGRVIEVDPEHATARDYLARVERGGATLATPTDPADQAWIAGDTARARELYEVRLAQSRDDGTAMLRVALMTAWNGQHRQALTLLDELVSRQPADLDARLARARVRAWSGDLPGAEGDVLEMLALEPDHPEAVEALALFRTWAGDFAGALEMYDDLLAISPAGGMAERQRAQALAWAADYESASAAYRALLERDPDDIDARLGHAQLLAYAAEYDASVREYDRVLELRPLEVRALSGKARTLAWGGRLAAAEGVAREAVSAQPTDAAVWVGLAQILRWQGRDPDALSALREAARLAPTSAEVLDQLRAVEQAFAPAVRPSAVFEQDSDDNRMLTTTIAASWHAVPRLGVRARAYRRDLEQGVFTRTARGVFVSGHYQLSPGWTIVGGLGGSETDGTSQPSFLEYEFGLTSPGRNPYVFALNVTSVGATGTAALAQRGVRATEGLLSVRWTPLRPWRVDGSVGIARYSGSESNGRRSAALAVSRPVGRFFGAGASFSGFSFEKDLSDGYFDPDFYGVLETTAYWLYRPGRWTVMAEIAPGIQRVQRDGDTGTSLRSNVRVAYGLGPGREVSLSAGYSSAGLVSFATGQSGYSYTALILGSSWAF